MVEKEVKVSERICYIVVRKQSKFKSKVTAKIFRVNKKQTGMVVINAYASTIPTKDTAEFGEAERRGRSLGGCGHAFHISGFAFQVLGLG